MINHPKHYLQLINTKQREKEYLKLHKINSRYKKASTDKTFNVQHKFKNGK